MTPNTAETLGVPRSQGLSLSLNLLTHTHTEIVGIIENLGIQKMTLGITLNNMWAKDVIIVGGGTIFRVLAGIYTPNCVLTLRGVHVVRIPKMHMAQYEMLNRPTLQKNNQ